MPGCQANVTPPYMEHACFHVHAEQPSHILHGLQGLGDGVEDTLTRASRLPVQGQPFRSGSSASKDAQAFGYMDLFHATATALSLPVVVFHDGLSPSFTHQHGTDRLRFVRVMGVGASSAYSQNDLRFEVFLDWLQVMPSCAITPAGFLPACGPCLGCVQCAVQRTQNTAHQQARMQTRLSLAAARVR